MSEPIGLSIKAALPCPFCGGYAELHKLLRRGHATNEPEAFAYFYLCDSCACTGGWGKSETAALHMWTMRPETKYCRGEGCPRGLCPYILVLHNYSDSRPFIQEWGSE